MATKKKAPAPKAGGAPTPRTLISRLRASELKSTAPQAIAAVKSALDRWQSGDAGLTELELASDLLSSLTSTAYRMGAHTYKQAVDLNHFFLGKHRVGVWVQCRLCGAYFRGRDGETKSFNPPEHVRGVFKLKGTSEARCNGSVFEGERVQNVKRLVKLERAHLSAKRKAATAEKL